MGGTIYAASPPFPYFVEGFAAPHRLVMNLSFAFNLVV